MNKNTRNKHFRTELCLVVAAGILRTGSFGQEFPGDHTSMDTLQTNHAGKSAVAAQSNPPLKGDDDKKPEESVAIGYGMAQKEELTGAVISLQSDALVKNPAFNVLKALQGRAAGVNIIQNSGSPGRAMIVRIRGVGTIYDKDPLFVVDGAPVHSIDFINPNDIESMSILKDASAMAIYGSRGANGVILVTTKKGKEGMRTVTYDMFIGRSQPWKEPDLCNASEWATLVNEARANAYKDAFDAQMAKPEAERDSTKYTGLRPYTELANPSSLGEGTDWFKEVTRKDAFIHQENVSVSQGNEQFKAFLSAGLFSQEGIIKGSGLDKIMLRLNTEIKIADWITLGNNLGIARMSIDYTNEQDEYNSTLINAFAMDPVTKVRDSEGNLLGSPYSNIKNPVGRIENFHYNEKNTVFNGGLYSDINIFNLLTFKTTFSMDILDKDSTSSISKYSIDADDQFSNALFLQRNGTDRTWVLENTLSYDNDFPENHSLKLLAGSTLQDRSWDSVLIETTGTPPRVQGMAGGNSLASFFGRLEYEFADKYLVTFTDRVDGSSQFAPKKRWGNFLSVAGAWKVSNEPFMENATFIDGLKFRAGWGKTGNQEISDYFFLPAESGRQNYSTGSDIRLSMAALSAGHWEAITSTNGGLDLAVLGGRIELSADYYIRRTDNNLVIPQIYLISGLGNLPAVNSASIENKGVEFVLTYREKIGSLLSNIGINFSTYKNEVLSLGYNDAPIMDANVRNSGMVTRTEVGRPIASFYALKTDGLFQTQTEVDAHTYVDKETNLPRLIQPEARPGDIRYRDDDHDGSLDRAFIGSPHPDFTAGLDIDLAFKGFDLGMSFYGVYGNDIFNDVRWYTDNVTGMYGLDSRMLDRWTGPGSTNDVNTPRMNAVDYNNILLSDRYVEDGSYLRLTTMQLGYSIGNSLLKRAHIKRCRVYVGAENLWTLTGYSGLEPEIGTGAGNAFTTNSLLGMGVDRGTYPQARTYMAGLNLTL